MILANDTEILLVEDDPVDAELMLSALKEVIEEASIHVLTDGAEALDYILGTGAYAGRNAESLPKVIFLDLKLPKINGFEVLQRIRLDKRTQSVPVVMFSSSHELSDIREGFRLGANSYVVKPVDAEQFMKAVAAIGQYWIHINETTINLPARFSE